MLLISLPWRRGTEPDSSDTDDDTSERYDDAVVSCEFQDGTLAVYDEEVILERVPRSKFVDKTIPFAEITGVEYESGITVGYLQIDQTGVEADSAGFLSDPIDENTLHFGRGGRECATAARDAILERIRG